MEPVDYVFYLSFVFFAFGASFFFKKGLVATKFLGILFVVLGLQIYLNYFIRPEKLLANPHFFRTVSPLLLLMAPLYFLFQRFLLYPERKLRAIHFLHFLPFLLHVIEYIPFYILPAEQKIPEIKLMIQQNTMYTENSHYGWISMKYQMLIRTISVLVYLSLMVYDLFNYLRKVTKTFLIQNQLIFYWLFFNLGMKLLIFFLLIGSLFFPEKYIRLPWKDFLYLVEYLLMILFIVLNPKLIYGPFLKGLIWQQANERISKKPLVISSRNSDSRIEQYKALLEKINRFFESEKIFLNSNLSLNEVARKLKVKPRLIRIALQSEMNLSFSDYVNIWRIQYAEEQCRENPKWKNYKLEVVALESGFGTRQSFNSAVKKIKGVSPGQYFSEFLY